MPVLSPEVLASRQPPEALSTRRPAGPRVHDTHVAAADAAVRARMEKVRYFVLVMLYEHAQFCESRVYTAYMPQAHTDV